MSFYCQHCHFKNTEVQSAGEIQEQGVKYVLQMDHSADMERQIVKSDTGVFRVEDLDLEIPPGHGKLTNLEGVLSEILRDLEHGQKRRKREEPDLYEKLDAIIQFLLKMMNGGRFPYSISLDDPAGNSWIEPSPKDTASKYTRTEYPRSPEQNAALGLGDGEIEELESHEAKAARLGITGPVVSGPVEGGTMHGVEILHGQMYSLPCLCPGCRKYAMMNVQMVNVPYFKQVIISAVVCSDCGYRTNDVKTGGEIPNQGQRILLRIKDPIDLRRDILKSETCCLRIPACRVEVVPGTMGGRFTTVEGLLTQIRDDLRGSIFDVDDASCSGGDSMPEERKKGWDDFFAVLDQAIRGEMQYTIHLEDPLSNSYIQSLTAPNRDPQIEIEDYERTQEEEEELGLADMRTKLNAEGEYVREVAESLSKQSVGQAILQSTLTTCSGISADRTGKGNIPVMDVEGRV
ncbi:MAG: hypothetical protein Q9187_004468 [Circinaria calcarea]